MIWNSRQRVGKNEPLLKWNLTPESSRYPSKFGIASPLPIHLVYEPTLLYQQKSSSQSYGFSSSHVWMWELEYKESWAPKNWSFWTVVLEKTLESPLDCKEIQPVHPKGNQSWIFIGRTDAEAETPVLWPPDVKSWLAGKDPDAGKDWGQEEKGTTEDETVGWHHRLNGRVWVNLGSCWWTGRPGVLWSMGSQSVGHNLVTEQQQRKFRKGRIGLI